MNDIDFDISSILKTSRRHHTDFTLEKFLNENKFDLSLPVVSKRSGGYDKRSDSLLRTKTDFEKYQYNKHRDLGSRKFRMTEIAEKRKESVREIVRRIRKSKKKLEHCESRLGHYWGLLEFEKKRKLRYLERRYETMKMKLDHIFESSVRKLEISVQQKSKQVGREKSRCERVGKKINEYLELFDENKNIKQEDTLLLNLSSFRYDSENLDSCISKTLKNTDDRISKIGRGVSELPSIYDLDIMYDSIMGI